VSGVDPDRPRGGPERSADIASDYSLEAGASARFWREALGQRLARGERLVLRAEGHSMWPTFRDGRHVVVGPLPEGGPRCGEVVLATLAGRLVLHRVVGVRADALLLKGDARPRPDGWVPRVLVVGCVDPGPAPRLVAGLSRLAGPLTARVLGWLRRRIAA
jgi:hypothetical protein